MSQPEMSVCIVNWNARELLRQCLASIEQAGTGIAIEVIVVDNASADGSADMVAAAFPQVILKRNDANEGFSRANNQAAEVSTGRYLLFLNNDTLVAPDSLANLLAFMQAHPEVGLAGPRLIGRDGLPQRSYRSRPSLAALLHRLPLLRWTGLFRRAYLRYRREEFDPQTQRPVEALLGAAVCLPREVFFRHGGWDESFPFGVEDFDLSTRVARTHQVVFFPGAEIVHFGKMSSRGNSGFAYTGVECGYVRYLRKHVAGPVVVGIYKLLVLLNLPIALIDEGVRGLWRRLRHGPAKPGKPHSELRAVWHFSTRGLAAFWRA